MKDVNFLARQNLASTKNTRRLSHETPSSLARLKATRPEGRKLKALVPAIAHDAFDDPKIWIETLQKSICRTPGGLPPHNQVPALQA